PGPDVFVGEGGNDTMNGMGGNDLLCGNDGNDVINGGDGGDRLDGGDGNDVVTGDVGNDTLDAGTGSDLVRGGDGDDTVDGGGGDYFDVLSGGPGNDTIIGRRWGEATPDEVDCSQAGGAVHFILQQVRATGAGAVQVALVAGKTGGWGNDTVSNIEGVFGSKFNDVLIGDGDSLLWGQAGDDEIHGQRDDRALFSKPVDADLARGTATGEGN